MSNSTAPIIFLLGPPGVGKSALGSLACKRLGIEFIDLAATALPGPMDGDDLPDLERLSRVIIDRAADVVELPWPLQQERKALKLARRSGVPLLLWAHPMDMQARSGQDEPLFTPTKRLKTRGGFGRTGRGCREFRRLDRAIDDALILVDLPFDEAVDILTECLGEIRLECDASPADREGIAGWVEDWRQDHDTSPRVSEVIVDAMARYLSHLRAQGASSRRMSGVYSDLNAAGHLVLMYDPPKGKRILERFCGAPWTFEFERKFYDSPAIVARFRRNSEGFARFLEESGLA